MKAEDFKKTTLSVLLPNGEGDLREFLASKYYERFGTDELIIALNSWKMDEARLIWNSIRNNPKPTLTQSEFKEWFFELEKQKPKDMDDSRWAYSMIAMASMMGPPVIEDTDEFIAKPLFTDESTS